MSIDHSGKGYTPLPQSLSNTDTEDEEERLTQPNDIPYKADSTTTAELHSNHENGTFHPLDETQNLENNTRNRQNIIKYYRDDIPIMVIEGSEQYDVWKRRDISPMRRFCLFMSILLCIITIIIFLYVLPCDSSMICSPIIEPHSSISWDKTLQDVEIYGPITVIPGSPYNLIFLLHGEQYKKNDTSDGVTRQRQIPPEGGGVISMQGNNGLPLWLVPLKRLPTIIDCTSIDIDQSGKTDCIVAGERGLLISIEPIAGTIHWSATARTIPKLPVIISDIDADNIEDLLSIAVDNANISSLVLLSGKTDVTRFMSLKELFHNLKIQVHKKFAESAVMPRLFEIVKPYENEYSWRPTPYHHLTIENEGVCPGQFCHTSINLTLQRLTNEPIILWDHVSSNTFASKPVFFMTLNKLYTSGFAIKFWQWMDLPLEHTEKTTITEQTLVERVLIIFVNYTDIQAINASQCDVIQLCHKLDCQPNLNSRKHFTSIDVKYINNNEFPELINYWSSYNSNSMKALISKIQVIKMDSIISNLIHGNV
ncbi:Protein ITFG3 [Trachymyrmex septentrionalis]|uniref:Protein ITFG3 n=1 Tax=Trachymyrmex septentrionalis TaxID=34720 RepID=A0A195FXJ8_9HYME|nr:Protein ITFG3 [Trachymyrmex septentrionalis]